MCTTDVLIRFCRKSSMWPSINAWDSSIIQAHTHTLIKLIIFMIIIIHVIFSFSLKRPRFYKFCKTSFLFLYIIFVMKINIVFVFDSVNDGQNIFVSVIVTVTEISLHTHTHHAYMALCQQQHYTNYSCPPQWSLVAMFVCDRQTVDSTDRNVCLGFNGTFSTNRLYHAITVG